MKTLAAYAPLTDKPASDLDQANENLNQQILNLEDLLVSLQNRLEPILNPSPEETGGAGSALECARAPLVAKLDHHAARTKRVADAVAVLLTRLCL